MRIPVALFVSFSFAASASAAQFQSAAAAMKALPPGAVANLARIEGREGRPCPERWHFVVFDPKAEYGVREYVVANGEVVAARGVSQFADELKPGDVIGADAVRIDSDAVSSLAQDFAAANNKTVASMNFELTKAGQEAAPAWRVVCMDAAGKDVGEIRLTAGKGTIIAHEGFPSEPKQIRLAAGKPAAQPEPEDRSESTPKPKSSSSRKSPSSQSEGRQSARSQPEPVAEKSKTSDRRSSDSSHEGRRKPPQNFVPIPQPAPEPPRRGLRALFHF